MKYYMLCIMYLHDTIWNATICIRKDKEQLLYIVMKNNGL